MRPNMLPGAICVIGAAALAACQPSPSPPLNAVGGPLRIEAPTKAVSQTGVRKPSVAKVPAGVSRGSAAVSDSRPASAQAKEDLSIATTITGCLVMRDDGMFQLKDTDGEHAPKARSWKSGFIKKGSADIDVLDVGNRLTLGSHAGYRVSVSGALTDRQLRARTLRATSERCDED